MEEQNKRRLLGDDGRSPHCKGNTCDNCGWNSEIAEARNADLAANGLTMGPDGLRRLIIRREVKVYGDNE